MYWRGTLVIGLQYQQNLRSRSYHLLWIPYHLLYFLYFYFHYTTLRYVAPLTWSLHRTLWWIAVRSLPGHQASSNRRVAYDGGARAPWRLNVRWRVMFFGVLRTELVLCETSGTYSFEAALRILKILYTPRLIHVYCCGTGRRNGCVRFWKKNEREVV